MSRKAARDLFHRLAAIGLALAILAPACLAQFSAVDLCSCGMKSSACFCKMMSKHRGAGAHCTKPAAPGVRCGMRSPMRSDGAPLPVSFDPRGWLQKLPAGRIAPDREPSGAVPPLDFLVASSPVQAPDPPPPKSFQSV
jgi:hypothetical protein